MFTMNDLFEIAIKMEKNGASVYTNAAEKIENKELQSLLKWMAGEEACHEKWFIDQKSGLALKKDEADLQQMVPQALQDMMGEKTLSLEDIHFSQMTRASELLQTFIGFEQDTIMFYELLEMFIEEKVVLSGLKKIIVEEKNHIKKINAMLDASPDLQI